MRSVEAIICDGTVPNPYTLTRADVGRPFGETLAGFVHQYDVGKQCHWVRGDGDGHTRLTRLNTQDCFLSVESTQQRDARQAQGSVSSKFFL